MMILQSKFPAFDIPNISFPLYLLEKSKRYGGRTAFRDGVTGERYSYDKYVKYVTQLANALHQEGVTSDQVVCIIMPNCIECAIAMLAVPALGAVLAFINPMYTAGEILRQLNDSNASYIMTTDKVLPVLNQVERTYTGIKKTIVVGESSEASHCKFWDLVNGGHMEMPLVKFDTKKKVAMLPYSSGTTGLPKGVMLSHYNVLASIMLFGTNSERKLISEMKDIMVEVFPMFHSGGIIFILLNIFYGCSTVLVPSFDFEVLLSMIQKYKATLVTLPPAVVLRLARDPLVDKYNLSSLECIVMGAAPTSKETLLELEKRLKIPYLILSYGMTENTALSHITGKDDIKLGSSGKLQRGVQCKVIDVATGAILGPHQDGELLIKGPGNMLGYLSNPHTTAQTIDQHGWLHTGDVGHYDEDEHFYIVDRVKELIKYKGFQVAPAELEAVVLMHPDVADVAVIGVPDDRAGEVPKAYVVLKKGRHLTKEQLHQHMHEHLTAYKQLRGGITFTDIIPKSVTGKILRNVLREQERKERVSKSKL